MPENPPIIEIDHGGGWSTNYIHLANIQVIPGQEVKQGQKLGNPSCRPAGAAAVAHVHFFFKRDGQVIPIDGIVLSGWTIHAADGNYGGTMAKAGEQTRCAKDKPGCPVPGAPSDLISDNFNP
jgi:murein DD-endopeptidase MepM/ murein hydrolase activator NlpD